MAKKTKIDQRTTGKEAGKGWPEGASPEGGEISSWFKKDISRRAASQRLGKGLAWAAGLGIAGLSIYKVASSDDDEISYDSLDLQRKEGWNVGSSKQLTFQPGTLKQLDSTGTPFANELTDPNRLIEIYQPKDAKWQPFFVPTLIQSLAQPTLRKQIEYPISTPAMDETYKRAEGLRELISQAANASQTLIIADLPGPESVALGAAVAGTADIVPGFDNWPHSLGVVRSHETLAAMLNYASEISKKKATLKADAPAVLLLDNQRLTPYRDEDTQFDNRHLAKIPPVDQLKQRGITSIIYVVPNQSQRQELDDLNDEFVEFAKNGIEVRILPLTDFGPYDEEVTSAGASEGQAVRERHYYYGGSPLSHLLFYSYYFYRPYPSVVFMRGGRSYTPPRPSGPSTLRPPTYRPVSRPTIFSATRVGGASGVGRTRPSGFGRTSVRMSGGRVTGTRVGRSGSYGRSGGWFGG
ncbi:MAG: hypothetical protein ABI882_20175 [Acidobacteriota bacterium]